MDYRRGQRFLIVIDGLDETFTGDRGDLVEVLASEARRLLAWMAVVATSRPEAAIKRQFGGLKPVEIAARSPEKETATASPSPSAWPRRISITPSGSAI